MISKTTDFLKSIATLISSLVQLAILVVLIGGGLWMYKTVQSIGEQGVTLPTIKVPDIVLPKMKMPDIELPSVKWPEIDLRQMFGESPEPNDPYTWTFEKEKQELSPDSVNGWDFSPSAGRSRR